MARIVVDKANYLADKFHHDVTICVANDVESSAYNLSKNVKLCKIGGGNQLNANSLRKIVCCFTQIKNISRLLNEIEPNIVVNAQTQVVTWTLPFIRRDIPKIMEIHFSYLGMEYNLNDKSRLFKTLYFAVAKSIYRRYGRFVILTDEDRHYWNLKNMVVINNFTQLSTDRLSDLSSKRIICVARYHVQKRLDLLIDAWAKIHDRHNDWKVEVFGMGPDKAILQSLIDKLGLTDSFILNDAVDDVKSEYLKSSIFALTSEHEGFGLVLLEAMTVGLPICMFNIVGVGWAYNNGQTVLACDFGDTESYAKNLEKLIENPQLRVKLRNNALKELPKYSIDHIMSQWNDLFIKCCNNA